MKSAIAFTCAACVLGALGAARLHADTRRSEAGALTATNSFFAGLAHGQLRQTCERLQPVVIEPLVARGGCARRLAALRSSLLGERGAPGALSAGQLIGRMRAAAQVRSVSADGTTVQVVVPPCLGVFTLVRTNGKAWRIARLPFA
jgi:hypothetical protein